MGRHYKGAFSWVELHIVRTKGVECLSEVFQVIFFPSAFHQHVVHINLEISPNLLREHHVHEPLVRHACNL